jgi:hypothetical protein
VWDALCDNDVWDGTMSSTGTILGLTAVGIIGAGVAYAATRDSREDEIADLAQTKFSTEDKPEAVRDADESPRSVAEIGTIFDAVETTVANDDKLEVLHDALYSQWSAQSVSNYLHNELQYLTNEVKVPTADAVLNGPNPGW